MIGPNVITLGGSWPECQTTGTKVISQKRRCDDEGTECQDGGSAEMVLVKKRRYKRTCSDAENKAPKVGRGVAVATKTINNNLIINQDNDRIISDETVLIIDANFGCTRASSASSISPTNTETISSFSDSMPSLEEIYPVTIGAESQPIRSAAPQTGSAPIQAGRVSPPQLEAVDNPNLSWLLDFKVSSLFDPDGSEGNVDGCFQGDECLQTSSTSSSSPSPQSSLTMPPPLPLPVSHPPTSNRLLKPPYTYTELIEQALNEKGQLTVSGIYTWMSEKYPFFKAHDERWKNSVRHNLSINPHFRKGMKASQGSGHFWTLSTQGAPPPPLHPNHDTWKMTEVKSVIETESDETEKSYIDEVATATASIEEPSSGLEDPFSPPLSITIPADNSPDPSLARTAEEILSGVKKEVQVQYLSADSDFLNQMTRGELADETNLTEVSTSFLMNDLGTEVILNDSFFCDDLNFQYCELTTAQM
ncbi:forkhead box protein J1 [Nilaparvata lugens]|uniref:forkhead box protein J1 n=1 Tax=Nilaparvata lugens TaxID=108931 RepID=UPI00193E02B4|nr:forkhead box protein J1 [Nilaparvata lugens]XP_039294732.1 forkhead box protein J1 [Nilaparvata lugens]